MARIPYPDPKTLLPETQDQLAKLNALDAPGLRAVRVSSAETPARQRAALEDVRAGRAKFLFITPEQLAAPDRLAEVRALKPTLVAVDEKKMLIARHHDWVRFFPFEMMGLSDKYKIQPPNMTDYGFTYDEDVLAKKLDHKPWDGAVMAEKEFNRRAEREHVSPDDLRRKLHDRYISQRNKILGLHPEPSDANNSRAAKKPSDAGESTEPVDSQSTSAAWKAAN